MMPAALSPTSSGFSRPAGYERRIVPLLSANKFGFGDGEGAIVGTSLAAGDAEVPGDAATGDVSPAGAVSETEGLAAGVSVAAGDAVASDPVDFAPEHAASVTAAHAQITRPIR